MPTECRVSGDLEKNNKNKNKYFSVKKQPRPYISQEPVEEKGSPTAAPLYGHLRRNTSLQAQKASIVAAPAGLSLFVLPPQSVIPAFKDAIRVRDTICYHRFLGEMECTM